MKQNPHGRLFSLYPLAQLALAFTAGVFISNVIVIKLAAQISFCAVCSLLAFVAFAKRKLWLSGLALLSAMFFAGASLAVIEKSTSPTDSVKRLLLAGLVEEEEQLTLIGVLNGPPEFARDRVYLVLRVEDVVTRSCDLEATGTVSLLATFKTATSEQQYRQLDLHYGARLRVKTTLNNVDKYRNPGVSTMTEYLERKGYDASGVVKNPNAIVRLGEMAVFKPLAWLYAWRENLQQQIDDHFSTETAGVLDAALLGNRYNLSKSTGDRFRDGGTFHVLVISGLHISFIGGLVFLVARRLTRKRILQFVWSGLVVWGYTLAVGAEGSVVRAALMFTFVAFGGVVFRSASALNALGGAALVLLIRSPTDLFDPSLQLTFLSVLAIVTIAWPLLQTFKSIGFWRPTRESPYPPACSRTLRSLCESIFWSEVEWKSELDRSPHQYRLFKSPVAAVLERTHLQHLLRYVFSAVVVSVGVQIVLLPLLTVYFHRLSLSSLILNIGVSLLLAILGAVALVALLVSQVSTVVAEPLFKLANGIDWIMVHSVDPFARAGLASVRLPEYVGWSSSIYFVYYLPLIVLVVALSRWKPLAQPKTSEYTRSNLVWVAAISQAILLGTVLLHPCSARRPDGKLHVDFLDVGQGDSALVTMPNGTTLLVDGGGRPTFIPTPSPGSPEASSTPFERESRSIGEMVVAEYLWWRGLDSVDYVLATHADADHIDGLNDVVRGFSVRSALVGRTPNSDVEYVKFAQTLLATKTHLEIIQAGDELHFGDVTATVLWPTVTNDQSAPSRNNDSIVLRLRFGERSILLTGDIEKQAEAQILASNEDLHVDVVKVPHHGSRTSSTEAFVSATRPQFAIISVGQTSMFGHPHEEVVERWGKSGAEVLTTGRCGTISVTTDGEILEVKRFVQE